jgi:hypothetical protein
MRLALRRPGTGHGGHEPAGEPPPEISGKIEKGRCPPRLARRGGRGLPAGAAPPGVPAVVLIQPERITAPLASILGITRQAISSGIRRRYLLSG